MTGARVRQEVRPMRVEELYERRQQRTLTMAAAEMLGVTERTFRRWSGRDDTDGVEGLQDRRLGRPSGRAVPVDEALRMVRVSETRSTGWTVKHFHERWQTEPGGTRAYRWTQKTLQAAWHVVRAPRRGAHRHEYPDGTLAVFHGPRCLARDHADGQLIETGRAHPGPTYRSNAPPFVDPRPTVRATISARDRKTRKKEPDRAWATYTRQVNLLGIAIKGHELCEPPSKEGRFTGTRGCFRYHRSIVTTPSSH